MKRGFLAYSRIFVGAALGVFAALGIFTCPTGINMAHADETAAPANVTAPTCLIKGTAPPPKSMAVYDAASGGEIIAKLTGAFIPMTLSEIPFDPKTGRARLQTSSGTGAMRIEGYVASADMPVFTTRDISIYGGNIWLSSAQKVRLVKATQESLTVEINVAGTLNQTIRATAPCDAFSLSKKNPEALEVPEKARGYMTKKETVELFDKPNGDVIFTLTMMEGTGQLFWSTESKAGFVHVTSRGDLTIDAWARYRDLDPLKKGEMVDQYIAPEKQTAGAQLSFDKPPPVVRATRPIPIRAKRDEKAKIVGTVEVDAEIYILETVAGWTNILPKHLGIVAPEDGGFWIPAAEAPK